MYKSQHVITSKHYLVLLVTAFAAGIFVSLMLGLGFALCITAIFSSVFILMIFFSLFFKKIFSRPKHYLLPAFLILSFLAGILRIGLVDFLNAGSIQKFAGSEAWVHGTISSEPCLTSNKFYHTFELDVSCIDNNKTNGTIVVYLPKDNGCDFHIGDEVFFWASLKKLSTSENAPGYDYFINLARKNIFLIANTKNINPDKQIKPLSFVNSVKLLGNSIRSKISDAADALFPENSEKAAILKGILIGDKSGFDNEMYNKFSNAGISHIVAVSGLHISILFSFLMTLFGFLPTGRKPMLLLAIPFVIIFTAASNFTPSALRAAIMIFIMIVSALLSESYNPVTSLFTAFGLLISFSPYSMLSKSLILSFSATLGIFVYFHYINTFLTMPLTDSRWFSSKPRILARRLAVYLASSISLSASSFLGTAYFILLFFGKISKVQFFTNLWIIPIVSAVFCLGYITCIVFYIFPWFSLNILKVPLELFLDVITWTTNFFGDNRFSYSFSADISSVAHATVYFGGALIVYMTLKTFYDIQKQKKITLNK